MPARTMCGPVRLRWVNLINLFTLNRESFLSFAPVNANTLSASAVIFLVLTGVPEAFAESRVFITANPAKGNGIDQCCLANGEQVRRSRRALLLSIARVCRSQRVPASRSRRSHGFGSETDR